MHTTDYIGTNKSYKDRLFRLLFADKKNGLELYNALNHTNIKYSIRNNLYTKC